MPDYRKKKVKKHIISNKKPPKKAKRVTSDVEMKPKQQSKSVNTKKQSLNVVKGKKLERIRRFRAGLASVFTIIIALVIISYILPVGISESVGNLIAQIGAGGYPYELYGTETLNAESMGNYYYVLTDTNLNIRSNNGKKILTLSHGYSNPVLKTSQSRALVFDQGGNNLLVTNLKKTVSDISTKGKILNADISRSGAFVVATNSDTYSSVVGVYNKREELLYEWYSAEESVNNVTISNDGKKIAVSTVNAASGKLKSKLYVFGYDSPNPIYTFDYGDRLIYALDSGVGSGFSVIVSNGLSYITWSKFEKTDYTSDLQLSMFRSNKSGIALVFNRSGNKSDNHIVLFSKKGKYISDFNFKGNLSDMQIARNHIYFVYDTLVSIYSKEGELLRMAECDYGAVRLVPVSGYSVAVIRNDDVSRLEIKGEEGK